MFGKMKDTMRMVSLLKPLFGQLEDFAAEVETHIHTKAPIPEEVCISFIAAARALLTVLKGEKGNGKEETEGEHDGNG